jgi:hypothetical protein
MIIGFILLAIAVVQVIIGLNLIFKYQRSASPIFYAFFSFAVALYAGANGLGFTGLFQNDGIFETLAWTGGMLTAVFILPFSYAFPQKRKTNSELLALSIWPFIIIVGGLLFSDLFIIPQKIANYGTGYTTLAGSYFWFMILIFAVYWIWAVRNLWLSFRTSGGFNRWMLRVLLIGLVVSVLTSTVFDIIFPLTMPTRFGYIGSLLSAIWVGATGYIMVRK